MAVSPTRADLRVVMPAPAAEERAGAGGVVHRYRFPPLQKSPAPVGELSAPGAEAGLAAEHHQGYQDGFRSGQERGYEEGFREGMARGTEQGYVEGLEAGRRQGEEQGRQVFAAAFAPAEALVAALEQTRRQRLAEQTDTICDLVTQIARRVIHAELSLQPQQILALVEEALRRLDADAEEERLSIYLNSEDLRNLAKVGVKTLHGHRLLADSDLATGDCRIVSSEAEMVLRTEQRLTQYVESFKLGMAEPEASSSGADEQPAEARADELAG
ncbi:MAG: FliH/SctL family protein [Spongiibacteraceae bacterium]|nr:FliH/SctL family protein [Spongiibacteraceae bacterium]